MEASQTAPQTAPEAPASDPSCSRRVTAAPDLAPVQTPPAAPKAKGRGKRKSRYVPWAGGYVRTEMDGRTQTYWIAKMVRGTRYHVSTKAHTLKDALVELDRFTADPDGYSAGTPDPKGQPVKLTAELIDDFLTYSREVKKNSPRWVQEQGFYLKGGQNGWDRAWLTVLGTVDLKRVSLSRDIEPALKGDSASVRQKRIAVLKALYGWLRKVLHTVSPTEDPTFGTLAVPQLPPAQLTKEKAFSQKDFRAVLKKLSGNSADAATVQAATGWHLTETIRFARSGEIEGNVLICPMTKGGEPLRSSVSKRAAAAARRLREHGTLNEKHYREALLKAHEEAGLKPGTVNPGKFRHSVATDAINRGASPAEVSGFLGHKSPRTTKRFYATFATPKKIPTLI